MIYVNSAAVSAVTIGAALALAHSVTTGPIVQIAIIVSLGSSLYVVLLRFVSPWTYNYVKSRLRDAIQAKRSGSERDCSASI
jgi:hypothetical protein